MSQVQEYKLEMTPGHAVSETVYVSQGDELWRNICFRLYLNGEPFPIPDTADAYWIGRRPDGRFFSEEMTADTDESTVSLNISDSLTYAAGPVLSKIMLEDAGGVIMSQGFVMMVEQGPDRPLIDGPRVDFARVDIARLTA